MLAITPLMNGLIVNVCIGLRHECHETRLEPQFLRRLAKEFTGQSGLYAPDRTERPFR